MARSIPGWRYDVSIGGGMDWEVSSYLTTLPPI